MKFVVGRLHTGRKDRAGRLKIQIYTIGDGNVSEITPRKRVAPNFSYTVGNGNTGEVFAFHKRPIPNFSNAIGNGNTGKA